MIVLLQDQKISGEKNALLCRPSTPEMSFSSICLVWREGAEELGVARHRRGVIEIAREQSLAVAYDCKGVRDPIVLSIVEAMWL